MHREAQTLPVEPRAAAFKYGTDLGIDPGRSTFIRDAWCSHWPAGVLPPFALRCKVSHLAEATDLRLYRLHYRHGLVRNAKIDHLLVHRDSLSGSRYIPEFE